MKKILDWKKYLETAASAAAEGIVMLKNDNGALPLSKDEVVSVFGRIQLHYYKSGTGSGGMVNVSKVTGIVDGLLESGVKLNEELLNVYKKWDEENPYDLGDGWGNEPWSQVEMPLDEQLVADAAQKGSTAIVIIGRTAGEEMDATLTEGSFLLTALEKDMLSKVRKAFEKVVVLLNVGGLIDMSFVNEYAPDSVLYVWQGGMTGGTGTADVLTGKVNTGDNCVVVGGGLVGAEVSNYLASLFKNVSVVEMRDGIALDEGPAPRKDLLNDMKNNGVKFYTETSVQEIRKDSVVVAGKNNEEIPADTVVLAIGRVPNITLAESLKAEGLDVNVIGDAKEPALAGAAIRAGYLIGRHL